MKLAIIALLICAQRAEAKGCHEHSFVVGYEHCSEFGEWSRDLDWPRVVFEFDGFDHRLESNRFALGAPSMSGPDLHTNATGTMLHIAVGIGPTFYVGGDGGGGGATITSRLHGLPPDDSYYVATHALAGIHTEVAHIELGGEVAAGFHVVGFSVCTAGVAKCTADISNTQAALDLDLRIRAAVYIVNHISLGVMYTHSLVDEYDHSIMGTLAFHIRTLDGM